MPVKLDLDGDRQRNYNTFTSTLLIYLHLPCFERPRGDRRGWLLSVHNSLFAAPSFSQLYHPPVKDSFHKQQFCRMNLKNKSPMVVAPARTHSFMAFNGLQLTSRNSCVIHHGPLCELQGNI